MASLPCAVRTDVTLHGKTSITKLHPRYRLSATALSIAALAIATNNTMTLPDLSAWGTSSTLFIPSRTAFNTSGILFNAFLANAPQFVLSVSYFTINRICTAICIAREWDNYGHVRKGLRVSSLPRDQQRSAHFLNIPYRWAIPLTALSGFLHWALSQAFYLARLEIRDIYGAIIVEESKCTCGYSPLSIVVVSLSFLALVIVVLALLLFLKVQYMPLAASSSLVISAACHPPPDDREPQLAKLQWGVVKSRFGGSIQHCTLTSEEVSAPVVGEPYA